MKVVVVGAGPGGLEAARVASLRGHKVTLLERRPQLGGALELWSRIPGRDHLGTITSWFSQELGELGVTVETGVDAGADAVLSLGPEVVICATGAEFSRRGESAFEQRPIPGSDQGFVFTPEDVLEGRVSLSGRVVVLDEEGRHGAAGIAEIAGRSGTEVHYVTRAPVPTRALGVNSHGGYVIARMRAAGVRFHTSTHIREIGDGTVTLIDLPTGGSSELGVDGVVLATMRVPLTELADALAGSVPFVYLIGDAQSPRSLPEATYEGHRFARVIGEPGMPKSVSHAMFARSAQADRPAEDA
jgi:dimethylamine/trimethylamine dehydrogenase